MHQSFFRPNYIFNNYAYFFSFLRTKIPFDLFQCKSLLTSTSLAFCVLNYEKQHKEDTCKVSGRSVVFSAFYADFCLCLKLVIITTSTHLTMLLSLILNKVVDRILPCGTPCSCSKVSDNVEPIRTLKDLSDKKFDIKFGNPQRF